LDLNITHWTEIDLPPGLDPFGSWWREQDPNERVDAAPMDIARMGWDAAVKHVKGKP